MLTVNCIRSAVKLENIVTPTVDKLHQRPCGIAAALLFFMLSACATTQAAGKDAQPTRVTDTSTPAASAKGETSQEEIAKHEIVKREIEWNRARADMLHGNSGVATRIPRHAVLRLPNQNANKTTTAQAVPILLPAIAFHVNAREASELEFSQPVIMLDANGYTAVLKSETIDIVIDATDSMLVTREHRDNDTPAEFDGSFQATEGGGGEVTVGRYGALYSIQLLCNQPSDVLCVTESMVREVIESLVIVELPTDARQ